jgi:hypothetical protein
VRLLGRFSKAFLYEASSREEGCAKTDCAKTDRAKTGGANIPRARDMTRGNVPLFLRF